jgi:hypothetical protein
MLRLRWTPMYQLRDHNSRANVLGTLQQIFTIGINQHTEEMPLILL